MPAKRNSPKSPVPFGMSNKQMKRKKPLNADLMRTIEPLTENQEKLLSILDSLGYKEVADLKSDRIFV